MSMLKGIINTADTYEETALDVAPVTLRYDYTAIPEEHRATVIDKAEAIKRRERRAAQDIAEIGRLLIDVRNRIEGQFLAWIDTEFGWRKTMAYEFINVAERFPKFGNVENFGLSALYVLSGPSVPDEAIDKANELAASGMPVTHQRARAIIKEFKPGVAKYTADAPPGPQTLPTCEHGDTTGKCPDCKRPLTSPESIERGRGPVCAAKAAAQEVVIDGECEPVGIESTEGGAVFTLLARKGERLAFWRKAKEMAGFIGGDTGNFGYDRKLSAMIAEVVALYEREVNP